MFIQFYKFRFKDFIIIMEKIKSILNLKNELKEELFGSTTLEVKEKTLLKFNNQTVFNDLENFYKNFFTDKKVSSKVSFSYKILSDRNINFLFEQYQKYQNIESISLDLTKNCLCKPELIELANGIKNFNKIQKLTLILRENMFESKDLKIITDVIGSLTQLTHLSLNLNSTFLKTGNEVTEAIKNLSNLISLDLNLNFNKLDDDSAMEIFKAIDNLKNLKSLSLLINSNKLTHLSMSTLSSQLSGLINMDHLTLSVGLNKIGDEGFSHVLQCLNNLTNLTKLVLDVQTNRLLESSLISMSETLNKLHNLTIFSLDWNSNKMCKESGKKLFDAVSKLNLISLRLSFSKPEIFDDLVDLLMKCPHLENLRYLELEMSKGIPNKDEGFKSILLALIRLKKLEYLYLSLFHNQLTSKSADLLIDILPKFHLQNFEIVIGLNKLDNPSKEKLKKVFGKRVKA